VTSSTPDALWSSAAVRHLQPAAVVCRRVRRRVGRETLLDRVDLKVSVGARLLLVANPDASASLLLRVLAGLSHADAGRFQLAGALSPDASAAGWGRRIAYVGPELSLFPWMSAHEVLALAARLIGLERADAKRLIDEAVDHWGLSAGRKRPISRMGLAFMQCTAMADALLGDPEVVLLDEPLRALEPQDRVRLLRLPGDRRTVVLASRYPASEAGVVDQVALLQKGRVELHAPISALEGLGLPLSMRGIETLAAIAAVRRESARPSTPQPNPAEGRASA
jgi:ABC-type multidrug transport system ATPase subunit